MEALHNEQANADFSVLCELLKDYIALTGAIKVGYEGESFSDPQKKNLIVLEFNKYLNIKENCIVLEKEEQINGLHKKV